MSTAFDTRLKTMGAYKVALGDFIMTWNQAENAMRRLLLTLCGPSPTTRILTAELGTRGLTDGLNAMATTLKGERRIAVETVVKLYNRIREYRNYYAHGISIIACHPDTNIAMGVAHMAMAKGKLAVAQDIITIQQLEATTGWANSLQDAVGNILDTIDPQEGSRAHPPLPSPETLLLPDRLTKTLRYPLDAPDPPLS